LALENEEEVQEAAKSAESDADEESAVARQSTPRSRASDIISLDDARKCALTRLENARPLEVGDTIDYYHRIFRNQLMSSTIVSMESSPQLRIRLENGDFFEGTDVITRGDDTGPLSSFTISRGSRKSLSGSNSSSKKRAKFND
jgi:hypothetical protein